MSSALAGRPGGMSTVSAVDYVGIPVTDLAASKAFYTMVLGMESDYAWGEVGTEFQVGPTTVALLDLAAIGQPFGPNHGPLALRVDDVAAERARLEASGVEFATQFDSGVCHQAIFTDPDGNVLVLHHRYAPAEQVRETRIDRLCGGQCVSRGPRTAAICRAVRVASRVTSRQS